MSDITSVDSYQLCLSTTFMHMPTPKILRTKDEEREDCTHIGVSLHDVASGELNASDRSMMTDMTLFANDSQPPSFIMAIAGDGDYFQALGALRQRGHTVILAYPHNRTSNELWEGFINRTLLVNPFSSLVWAEEPVIGDLVTGVFWHEPSCPAPAGEVVNTRYMTAATCINRILQSHDRTRTASALPERYYCYSDNSLIARYLPIHIQFVFTSQSPEEMEYSVESTMLVDVLLFVNDFPPPANVVILTTNEDIARMVHILERRGYTVLVVIPNFGRGLVRLERSGSRVYSWYD